MTRPALNVRDFGARGDGASLDTAALNAAISAGGRLIVPAGRYLCFSIRLLSGVHLTLEEGAVIVAADPAMHPGAYDPPEPNPHDLYQDFGHSHWRNSLIWGEGVEDVAIDGPGLIDGAGLTREGPGSRWTAQSGEFPLSMAGLSDAEMAVLVPDRAAMVGQGNKAIGLKTCRGVVLRDFTILKGGHFAILATGCQDLTLQNLRIDTDRDGIDIDSCKGVRIAGCRVNTPNDDAIVLKSSRALGQPRFTEDVEIADCLVSGYDLGTTLHGPPGRTQTIAPDQDGVTGRIKLGTESSGGFRNIHIRDCAFERSRGLALEVVDGGVMEDVTVERLILSEVTTAPIFLRIGDRRRGPAGTGVGVMRRIVIRDVEATDVRPDFAAILAGLPGHPIQDVTLDNIRLSYRGGGTVEDAARRPGDLADAYPEPSMFGVTPAFGLWARHVDGLRLTGVHLETLTPDARPPLRLEHVQSLTGDLP
ncbi:rhamnogalacturonidase [Caulobacter sp.]|uniref:rhamnogalacturonidase n=1 Tax=Caulobacter sp. TaxID=78 RepID=UPI003BAA32B4